MTDKTDDQIKQLRKEFHVKQYKNPPETVVALGEAAAKKASMEWHRILLSGVLAGSALVSVVGCVFFIGIGGAVSVAAGGGLAKVGVTTTTIGNVTTTTSAAPILPKLVMAATFPIGLVLVMVLGAELFTGNVMTMSLGLLARRITWKQFLLNWSLSYTGNFIGSVITAAALLGTHTYNNEPYLTFLHTLTEAKIYDDWGALFLKGVLCNILVCSAVYMAVASEDITSKIVAIYAAVFTFIACGFEHSIANMFYLNVGIMYGANAGYGDFLWRNLLSVTLGNICGSFFFLALPYYYIYYVVLAPKVLLPKSEIMQIKRGGSVPGRINEPVSPDIEMGIKPTEKVEEQKNQKEESKESRGTKSRESKTSKGSKESKASNSVEDTSSSSSER